MLGRTRRRAPITATILIVLASLAACTHSKSASTAKSDPAAAAARAYLSAFLHPAAAGALTTDPTAATAALTASLTGLGAGATVHLVAGKLSARTKTSAIAAYTATWTLPGSSKPWTYSGTLPLLAQPTPTPTPTGSSKKTKKLPDTWLVRWVPSDVAPRLVAGQHLATVRTVPTRATLLDSSGGALFTLQKVIDVGINPAWVTDLNSLAATLSANLGVPAASIVASVQAAPKGDFVPVITLREAAYDKVRAKIHDLPGTQFNVSTEMLAPSPTFAQPLLGQVGPATAEIIAASHGTIQAGDMTGLSGLQLALNGRLEGTPGLSVDAVDANGNQTPLAVVSPAVAAKPIPLTLNPTVQNAAQAALAGVTLPATIVVTQPSTGEILAVASNPAATADGDIALTGAYPPGSTFKMATYLATFTAHPTQTPKTSAPCPGTTTINGQTIRNENNFDLGTVALASAFAYSCNTTAARLGVKLPSGALQSAAAALGLGAKWTLPIDAFSGSMPAPVGPTSINEQAADSYGQGQVLVSPLLMAEMAGGAATGRTVAPSIVVGEQAPPGPVRPARITADMNTLMRDVVKLPGATGRGLADLPGRIEGKTGTAEFGTAVPAQTHSWFAGVRGDLAMSVFIYGGGSSGTGAVPVARKFLLAVP